MPDSKSDCSIASAQSDSTIAFAYIKVLKTNKKRFFVLKSMPKASPWESEGTKPPMDYFLYMYKNEKNYQKSEPKLVYNLGNVILLSRCTKKDNNTVLGICFQKDALFLKFATEDELTRWYFHLSEIYNVKRNCRWPELLHCFSVNLKPKDLASTSAKHGKTDLAGQYRFCITESDVLLVDDNLLSPALCLPFRCIRSLAHSISATFFQLHLGRLSPIGEGVLHFEVEQSCMLKEVTETLMRCLSEARNRSMADGAKIITSRGGRRNSRDSVNHSGSMQSILRRGGSIKGGKQQGTKSISTFSERIPSIAYSTLTDDQRTYSQPLSENFEDYCDLSVQPTAATNRSLNSSSSLSGNSELTGTDHGGASPISQQQQQQQQQQNLAGSDESSIARVTSWRLGGLDTCASSYDEAGRLGIIDRGGDDCGSPALGSRANSIGCRPPASCRMGSYLYSSFSVPSSHCGEVSQTGGHRDDRQVFVEVNFPRPRTTSDAAKHRIGGSRFRPRTGSYGNRSVHRPGGPPSQPEKISDLVVTGFGEFGTSGMELHSLQEAGNKEDDPYVQMSLVPQSAAQSAASGGDSPTEPDDEEDPYWVNPSTMDHMIRPAAANLQQCSVEH